MARTFNCFPATSFETPLMPRSFGFNSDYSLSQKALWPALDFYAIDDCSFHFFGFSFSFFWWPDIEKLFRMLKIDFVCRIVGVGNWRLETGIGFGFENGIAGPGWIASHASQ